MSPLRLTLVAGLCVLMSACAAALPTPVAPITGGWVRAEVNETTTAVAAFAAGRIGAGDMTIRRIEAAETQVVAGLNYRLTLKLSDGSHHRVVVWRRLDGSLELSSDINLP